MFISNQAVFITCNTIQRRFLLKPTPAANKAITGILARCTNIHPTVRLHAFVFLSNHYHLIVSAENPCVIPKFMALLNTELAKKVGSKIHKWTSKIFDRRYAAAPILDEGALAEKLSYIFMHGGKEGLVETPNQWPGLHCIQSLVEDKKIVGYWRDESRASSKRAADGNNADISDCDIPYELKVAPLAVENPKVFVLRCYQQALAQIKEIRKGKKALGKKTILKEAAHAKPNKRREPKLNPWCHAVCAKLRADWKISYQNFCATMREATVELGNTYRREFITDDRIGFLPSQI